MNTTEVFPLTERGLMKLLRTREAARPAGAARGRRKAARWPFPGVVEMWIPDDSGEPQHTLATSVNLSLNGIGIRCDDPLECGLELDIAFHEPEMSFHGRASVRHCTKIDSDHLIGLQFVFDKECSG